ncbi:MAG: hypothetical protein SGJ13_08800 [Actinomycetota bacterium]|nr:hypothetical protein [Actinomycetota bacterium]
MFTLVGVEFAYGMKDFDMFVDGIWSVLQAETIPILAEAIRGGDFDAVYAVHEEFAPFWCRPCRRSYCRDHWELEPVFDPPRQFDYYRGTCPAGQPTMIDHM